MYFMFSAKKRFWKIREAKRLKKKRKINSAYFDHVKSIRQYFVGKKDGRSINYAINLIM